MHLLALYNELYKFPCHIYPDNIGTISIIKESCKIYIININFIGNNDKNDEELSMTSSSTCTCLTCSSYSQKGYNVIHHSSPHAVPMQHRRAAFPLWMAMDSLCRRYSFYLSGSPVI